MVKSLLRYGGISVLALLLSGGLLGLLFACKISSTVLLIVMASVLYGACYFIALGVYEVMWKEVMWKERMWKEVMWKERMWKERMWKERMWKERMKD